MVDRTKMTMDAFVELVEQNPDRHFTFNAEGDVIEVSPKRIHSWMRVTFIIHFQNYINALPRLRSFDHMCAPVGGLAVPPGCVD